MKEIWKDIPEYEGSYQISNLGRVRSLDRMVVPTRRGKNLFFSGMILKPLMQARYPRVSLAKNQIYTFKCIHRLLAEAFIPNPENKPEINHKNGIKTDYRLENLEWVTRSENMIHSCSTGLSRCGEKSHHAKLKIRDVMDIRESYKAGHYNRIRLAKKFKVTPDSISNIINRKTWKYV